MKRGLYRIQRVGDLPNDVRVDDDGIEVPLKEHLYRARDYQPPFEHLPSQYLKLQRSADSRSSSSEGAEKAARDQARQEFLDRFREP